MGGTLFFSANDGTTGPELWKSDGTEAGTVLVKDINPNISYGYPVGSYPHYLTDVGGTLFFAANDGTNSLELWKSDGTEAGTVLVADINPGDDGSLPNHLTAVGGMLYFTAFVPVHRHRAVEERRDGRGHRPGRGHPPRQRGISIPTTWRSSTGRCSSPPTTA